VFSLILLMRRRKERAALSQSGPTQPEKNAKQRTRPQKGK
jgi:hypothetical protein